MLNCIAVCISGLLNGDVKGRKLLGKQASTDSVYIESAYFYIKKVYLDRSHYLTTITTQERIKFVDNYGGNPEKKVSIVFMNEPL